MPSAYMITTLKIKSYKIVFREFGIQGITNFVTMPKFIFTSETGLPRLLRSIDV